MQFKVSNITNFTNNQKATLLGKNGFDSIPGRIRVLCSDVEEVDGNTVLTIESLPYLFDENFYKHILEVNDDSWSGLKGRDFVSIPVNLQKDTGERNFVNFAPVTTQLSANILSNTTNTVTIEGSYNLEDAPFYVEFNQLLDKDYYANNSFFVGGTQYVYTQKNTNITPNAVHVEPLNVKPIHEKFVTVYVDGEDIAKDFSLDLSTDPALLTIDTPLPSDASSVRVEIDHYTAPIFEVGDNVQFATNNIHVIANTTFDHTSTTFNSILTSNNIYVVRTSTRPTADLAGATLVNISPDPVGTITDVDVLNSTVNLNYSVNEFRGNFNLSNSKVYSIQLGGEFEKIFLSKDRIIKDVPSGTIVVKARNKNLTGRSSPFVTKSITIGDFPIRKVKNLNFTESLFKEQSGGVSVRALVDWEHVSGQEVTDYELSYLITKDFLTDDYNDFNDLTSYQTVKIPANNVDDDGKVRHVINNVDRGTTSFLGKVSLTVRVTPLNKNLRGETAVITKQIEGKQTPPKALTTFNGGQNGDLIVLFWEYERQDNGELLDLDLKDVVIKRLPGSVDIYSSEEEPSTLWNVAQRLITVSAGSEKKSIPIDIYGTYTYLARTRDTSGNFSDYINQFTITSFRPSAVNVFRAYNEDTPSEDFTELQNENYYENNFTSVTETITNGLNVAAIPSTISDNANASAGGWTYNANTAPTDLLSTGTYSYYQTPLRDLRDVYTVKPSLIFESSIGLNQAFHDFRETILEGVTEFSGTNDPSIFSEEDFGGIGTVLGYNNNTIGVGQLFSVSYNNSLGLKTLVDNTNENNVYAIWNDGQFSDDSSNSNSYALIAGVIDQNKLQLGQSFYANGMPTGGNGLANVTTANSGINSYKLVNFKQFSDTDVGSFTGLSGSSGFEINVYIRFSTANSEIMFDSNGNVNVAAFTSTANPAIDNGFVKYQAGAANFRYFQFLFEIYNNKQDTYELTLDKLRYVIEKEVFTAKRQIPYTGTPTTLDISDLEYALVPSVSVQPLATTTAQVGVLTSVSQTEVSFKVWDVEAATYIDPADGVDVQLIITGI